MVRARNEHRFVFPDGQAVSNQLDIGDGCFGSLIVPSGSGLIGKTLNVRAVSRTGAFSSVNLLATAKTLASGSNPFTAEELLEIGAASVVELVINTAVSGADSPCFLLWKS